MPVTLNHPATKHFDQVEDLGIALRLLPGTNQQQHLGMLYKLNEEPARVCHLRTHFDLMDEIPSNNFRWLQVELDEINRRLVASLTEKIAKRGNKIQYGFAYDGDYFTLVGEYIRQETGRGLTCSTFILAIFRRVGIELLKCEEWVSRPEDKVFQLEQTRLIGDRYPLLRERIATHIGDPRFKPDEVAVGAASESRPLGFGEAKRLARQLARDLERSYGKEGAA